MPTNSGKGDLRGALRVLGNCCSSSEDIGRQLCATRSSGHLRIEVASSCGWIGARRQCSPSMRQAEMFEAAESLELRPVVATALLTKSLLLSSLGEHRMRSTSATS